MPERPRLTPAMADVRRAVRECWERNQVSAGELVLVACSGGADSLALAAAAIFEGSRSGVHVGAVIVEHGLQPATKQVAADTAELLGKLGAQPVIVKSVKVGKDGGPEAAAREARYQAIDQAAQEAKLDLYEGMPHNFASRIPDAPESLVARAKIASFIRRHLGGARS